MKHSLTFFILFMTAITVTIASYAYEPEIEPVEESQPEPFICPCAKPFGQLQAHLDCHEVSDYN